MSTKQIEALKLALEALTSIDWVNSFNDGDYLTCNFKSVESAITAIREALAEESLGTEQPEFITHSVEQPYDWSEWVCPDPKGYLMKCCDCGLVHEAEFGVVRYKSETEREDCEPVDDPNLQAVFRMRRSEPWSPADTAHRAGGLPMAEQPAQQPERCQCPECQITLHASDCAVHNEPAYQKGSCDCGAQQWNAGVPSLYPEPEPGVSIKATYEQPAQQEPDRVKFERHWRNTRGEKKANRELPRHPLQPQTYIQDSANRHWVTWQAAVRSVSPPASKQWVGLTDDEIIDVIHPIVMSDMADEATDYEIARAIEAKLREKNAAQEGLLREIAALSANAVDDDKEYKK